MNSIQKAKIDELRTRLTTERGITAPLPTSENNDGTVTVLVNGSGHVNVGVRGGIDLPNVRSYPETGKYPRTAMGAAVHADELEGKCSNGYRISQWPLSANGVSTRRERERPARTADPYNFVLQFDESLIAGLVARRMANVEQDAAFKAGSSIAVGDYSRKNLKVIVDWKLPQCWVARVMALLDQNTDTEITAALRSAITADSERSAVEVLDRLFGVGVPVASAILTTINPLKYTIIDVNALRSLGVETKPTITVDYYLAYLHKCRGLAHQLKIDLRSLDHALWQWGYEHSR